MSETNPQILVNGEEQQEDPAAGEEEEAEEEKVAVGPEEERPEDKQAKIQSMLQQMRNRIRSQVGMKTPKSSIAELVQKVREMELVQVSGEAEGREETSQTVADQSKDEATVEELSAIIETKLEASRKALRDEFEGQISQVRAEMRAYTDQALKDLEVKMESRQSNNQPPLKDLQDGRGPDRKPKPSAPSLANRRGRVLTRTMTTIIPKTCAPVIVGPRAKSETLYSSKCESSRFTLRDAVLANKPGQNRRPLPPPACPPLEQRKRVVPPKTRAGK